MGGSGARGAVREARATDVGVTGDTLIVTDLRARKRAPIL
jgi:hypothetical protein